MLRFPQFLARIRATPFAAAVATLVGGTAFAQGLMVAVLPLLTRLYSPADFEVLALFTASLSLVTVVSCLRLNIAIPLPDQEQIAATLLVLSLAAASIFSALGLLAVTVFGGMITELLGEPAIAPYLWLLPIGILMSSAYTALQYWASRKKRFTLITKTRVVRALTGAGAQVGVGVISPTPLGLITGQVLYTGMGSVRLAIDVYLQDRRSFSGLRLSSVKAALTEYRRFPLLSVPEALFDSSGIQVPILIIASYSIGPEAGFMVLAMQVLGAPIALIGGAVSQVYLAEAPDRLRHNQLSRLTRRTVWTLFRLGGPLIGIAAVLAPFVFPVIFGAEWTRAGYIVSMLAPSFLLQFIVAPVSMVLHVTGNVLTAVALQAFGFVLRVGAVSVAAGGAQEWLVEVFAISSAVYYLVYLLVVVRISQAAQRM